MDELVIIENGKVFTTSRIIAECGDVEHHAIIQLVRKYKDDLNEVGTSDFQMRKYRTSGRIGEEAILDEEQATFIITLMKNSMKVVQFKKRLTKEFFKQRDIISKLIAQRDNPDWQNVRKDGKTIYFQKTDIIKRFVDYATLQGSQSSQMYYINFTKMENSALFFFEQKYKNLREIMTIKQLMQVATADQVIERAIQEGMDEKMFYKDIYKLAKDRITDFANIIGKSPILQLREETL